MIPGGARSNASRKSSSETYSRITLISSCRAYVMAYAMNRTGFASALSGGANHIILGATPNIYAVPGDRDAFARVSMCLLKIGRQR